MQHLGQIGVKRMMNHKLPGMDRRHDMYNEYKRKQNLSRLQARG